METNPEFDPAYTWWTTTCELLGIYLKEGVFDIGMLAQFHPYFWLYWWNMYKPILQVRTKRIGPTYLQNMKYLFTSLEKYFEEHPEQAPPVIQWEEVKS